MSTPKHACSFCGLVPKSLHLIRLPRGTYSTCTGCLRRLSSECQAINQELYPHFATT